MGGAARERLLPASPPLPRSLFPVPFSPFPMLLLVAALALQLPDTLPGSYDSPATRELVERAVAASGELPEGLDDYRATVETSMFITLAPDSAAAGDLPASVDELVSEVRWNEQSYLHQTVRGHRTRLLIPLPYTLATLLEQPWVVPHLYGGSIYTPLTGPRAVSPFGAQGPLYYRYAAGDPVRLRVQGELITLVPVEVRPAVDAEGAGVRLVLGTFYLDADRAAVARARFGFAGTGGDLPRVLGRVETFMELENALWEGRFWLPFRQRREIVFSSRALGGSVVARVVNRVVELDLNTGWSPSGTRVRLAWTEEDGAFADWEGEVGEGTAEFSVGDFEDLRLATTAASPADDALRPRIHYDQGSHLFRYNRVEGPFLGLGARLTPPDPRHDRWAVYGTAGWAFAERAARGELSVRRGLAVAPSAETDALVDWGLEATAYRRLPDMQAFRPTYSWDWIYTLPALFWGSDTRDYYDALGVEAFASARRGRWTGRLGGRVERHDSVEANTGRFLFGEAEEFGPVAAAEPGTHAAIEAGGGYSLGPGAFGVGNSLIAQASVEAGVGDFRFQRVLGLLSFRSVLGPFTLAVRADGGHVTGGAPPQKLFRFGSLEGLRGYEPNEFGGSTAALARGRFLVGLPPRSSAPIARVGFLLLPPLRPSLVLVGASGWSHVDGGLADDLARLGAVETDGWRSAVGLGISFLEDAFTIERLEPVGAGSGGREGRWYIGLTTWY